MCTAFNMQPSSNGLIGGSKSLRYVIVKRDAISQVVFPERMRNEWKASNMLHITELITTISKQGNVSMFSLSHDKNPEAVCKELL